MSGRLTFTLWEKFGLKAPKAAPAIPKQWNVDGKEHAAWTAMQERIDALEGLVIEQQKRITAQARELMRYAGRVTTESPERKAYKAAHGKALRDSRRAAGICIGSCHGPRGVSRSRWWCARCLFKKRRQDERRQELRREVT